MNIKTAIIADDFTGAGDSSIHFCHAGYSVFLPLSLTNTVLPDGLQILAVNTETRLEKSSKAYTKTMQAVEMCRNWGTESFYKKIDSTMRGNIDDEIRAVVDAGRYNAVIVCPAAPDIGRTVVNGQCLLHGTPIDQTETGQDHLSPVQSSFIKDCFGDCPREQLAHISTNDIERGPAHLAHLVNELMAVGATHLICDATTNDHLATIATLKSNCHLLLAGAAGLAAAIAKQPTAMPKGTSRIEFAAGNILVSSGSRMEISRLQLDRLAETRNCTTILVPTTALITGDQAILDQFWADLKNLKVNGDSCLILTPDSAKEVVGQTAPKDNSEKIAAFIAKVTDVICQALDISVLISIGGHTTYQVVKKLGATGVTYEGEVLPGTPFGHLQLSGRPHRLTLVTKSGSFGDQDALIQIYDFAIKHMKTS